MSEQAPSSEKLSFASLAAHQLKGPVATAAMLLKTLLGEYAGPLTPQQRELVMKAMLRCEQALESAQRILAIARGAQSPEQAATPTNLSGLIRKVELQSGEEARRGKIQLEVDIGVEPAWVCMAEPVLTEVVDAVVSNAFKYTPQHGRIRLSVQEDAPASRVILRVGDSGTGIPPGERERVFEPFYRTRQAVASARPGSGLGLAFVKSAVEAVGGEVHIETSPLGGAEIVISLRKASVQEETAPGEADMSRRLRVVIIGGSVAGPKVAARIMRLRPDAQVTVVDKNQFLAVSGCGLPYYMSGLIKDTSQLLSTPAGTLRDPVFFQRVKNFQVMNQTEAVSIDRSARTVVVRDLTTGKETVLHYDRLVLATGSAPLAPSFDGKNLEGMITLHGLHSAERIRARLATGKAHDVVIVGGGILGVEITDMLVERGCRVTIVEKLPQLMHILDAEMAALVENQLESKGVKILTDTEVLGVEGNARVERVVTSRGPISADLVITAMGFRPEVRLAAEAGLALGPTGAIRVDDHMRTSDPCIYAAGDCVETTDLLTGRPVYHPYGSVAVKQGRVAATNICGGDERFPGIAGSAVCKVFDYCVARTGLTEQAARELGYETVSALVPGPDRAHYMPTARQLMLKMVVDRRTRRLLGVQAVGPGEGHSRVDMAAVALTAGMTVDQVANLDLTYAPPYSPVMDHLIVAANVVRNKLEGRMVGVSSSELRRMMDDGEDFVLLDVRTPAEYEQVRLPRSTSIPLGTLRGRLEELPRDKEIVTVCPQGLRGYEAGLVLRAAGFERVRTLDGGLQMWPYEKIE